jgi:hypothetical protein
MAVEARARAWRIGAGGRFFQPPGGAVVSLDSRPTLARILDVLVARRLASTEVVTTAELLAAGWMGERMVRAAAANRLRVAMSTLRKLGLEPILIREAAGYRLDPAAVVVSIVEPA